MLSEDRYYNIGSMQYPSVTTILKIISKPGLMVWLAKQQEQSIKDITEKALDIGSQAHAGIAALTQRFLGKSIEIPPVVDDALIAIHAWDEWVERESIKFLDSEVLVWCEECQYAGTLDFVATTTGSVKTPDKTPDKTAIDCIKALLPNKLPLTTEKSSTCGNEVGVRIDKSDSFYALRIDNSEKKKLSLQKMSKVDRGVSQRELKNPAENECYKLLRSQGWQVTKRGWPDFIAYKKDQVIVVEVKKNSAHSLRQSQWRVFKQLGQAGIPCYKYTPERGMELAFCDEETARGAVEAAPNARPGRAEARTGEQCVTPSPRSGSPLIIGDYKTSKALYRDYELQVVAYAHAWLVRQGLSHTEAMHPHRLVSLCLIRLPKTLDKNASNGIEVKYLDSPPAFPLFLAARDLWRFMQRK